MKLWKQGNLNELLHKAVTIQRSLKLISWSCDIGEASTKILHIKGIFMDWQKVILHIVCQELDGSIHVFFITIRYLGDRNKNIQKVNEHLQPFFLQTHQRRYNQI